MLASDFSYNCVFALSLWCFCTLAGAEGNSNIIEMVIIQRPITVTFDSNVTHAKGQITNDAGPASSSSSAGCVVDI